MRDRKARYAFLEAFALARICSDSPGRSVLGRPFEAYRRRSQPLFRAVPGVLFLEYALRSISFPETLTDRDRVSSGIRGGIRRCFLVAFRNTLEELSEEFEAAAARAFRYLPPPGGSCPKACLRSFSTEWKTPPIAPRSHSESRSRYPFRASSPTPFTKCVVRPEERLVDPSFPLPHGPFPMMQVG
mgnify:CR=1 FL=1